MCSDRLYRRRRLIALLPAPAPPLPRLSHTSTTSRAATPRARQIVARHASARSANPNACRLASAHKRKHRVLRHASSSLPDLHRRQRSVDRRMQLQQQHPASTAGRPSTSTGSSYSSSSRWRQPHCHARQQQAPRASRLAAAALAPQQLQGEPGAAVRVFYRSGWPAARLHGSVQGGSWQDYALSRVTSAPGKWLVGTIPINGSSSSSSAPLVEFVVTDGGSQWDKPPEGGNYTVTAPGSYTLRRGALAALPAAAPPVMLVSDLDGTMVGDDAATAAFKDWWEAAGVLHGGLLVYNTGRALESFERLLQDKAGCLAHPDVLISAVGTKIYNFTPQGTWQEDKGWVAQLDVGWRVEAVREAAYAALAKVGKEAMHFRPPEEQNDHKVTCGVSVAALQRVLDSLRADLDAAGVAANIITSGTGDWRFLDLVPQRAGKLEALDYVRSSHGFSHADTVAAGDSGNDILMLSGRNLAIVVGNAQPDLVAWLDSQQAASDESPLPGKLRLLRAGRHEALGILEGLEYFGFK